MRKNQTLIIAVVVLLCSAVAAQAQGTAAYEAFANGVNAREGGAAELSASIALFLRGASADHGGGKVTAQYSVPLAEETSPMMNTTPVLAADMDAEDGVVTFTLPASGTDTVVLSNVRLDLREASAPVTVTLTGDSLTFVSGVFNVVSSIQEAMEVTSKSASILTRGASETATVTIEETFSGAWTTAADVLLRITGVPDEAILKVSHAGYADPSAAGNDDTSDDADIGGTVMLDMVTIVDEGNILDEELTVTGDGDAIDITIDFDMPVATSKDSLVLTLELDAGGEGTATSDDLALPLDEGMVRVMASMAPDEVDTPDADTEYFTENFIPAAGSVAFTIDPARCTLLYPYVTYNAPYMIDTGIAVTNPTGFGGDALSGPIKFSLYGNDSDPESYTTGAGTPGGMDGGLDENGNLDAGKTYSVLLSQLLAWLSIEGPFQGHIYVETDFTRCSGLGLVWDNNGTYSQGYIPELIADEVTAGERGRTVNPQ